VFGVGFDLVKKSSSAELNRSWTAGTSSLQYPSRLARRSSELRRAWSEAEHMPDQPGDAYWIGATVVARNMSCRDMDGVPCSRSTRIAYSRLELDDSNALTWSAAVSLSLTMTPMIRRVDTRSMSERGGGGARFRLIVKTISFVLFLFSLRLLLRANFADGHSPVDTWQHRAYKVDMVLFIHDNYDAVCSLLTSTNDQQFFLTFNYLINCTFLMLIHEQRHYYFRCWI